MKIYEIEDDGAIKPNPIFHRPWDKLHSRCIEYPFAASRVAKLEQNYNFPSSSLNARENDGIQRVLDVGSAKADPIWVHWLESLPVKIYFSDFDPPEASLKETLYHRADLRCLPLPDNCMDQVLAISVIEHIGLDAPQVKSPQLPVVSNTGDLEAVREMVRVLKPGGELVMTFPLGIHDNLILNGEVRSYTLNTIRCFDQFAKVVVLDYYEYQYIDQRSIYIEYTPPRSARQQLVDAIGTVGMALKYRINKQIKGYGFQRNPKPSSITRMEKFPRERDGVVTWRRVPIETSQATHYKHVDGVLCGVWRKM